MISYYAFHYHIYSCAYLSLINFPRHFRLIYSFTAKIFGVFFLSLRQWTERQVPTICILISLWKDCVWNVYENSEISFWIQYLYNVDRRRLTLLLNPKLFLQVTLYYTVHLIPLDLVTKLIWSSEYLVWLIAIDPGSAFVIRQV